jgi:hypothetical protein
VLQHGPSDFQAADLFLPSGDGPHPLAILIHGGCWSVTTAGREQLQHIGAELASRGIAVWSIGYRRANESGGGYPGTFQDVGAAIDWLRSDAPALQCDWAKRFVERCKFLTRRRRSPVVADRRSSGEKERFSATRCYASSNRPTRRATYPAVCSTRATLLGKISESRIAVGTE